MCAANIITFAAPPCYPMCRSFLLACVPEHYVFHHARCVYDALVRSQLYLRDRHQHPALPMPCTLYDQNAFPRMGESPSEAPRTQECGGVGD